MAQPTTESRSIGSATASGSPEGIDPYFATRRCMPSSTRKICASSALHSRAAFSATAWSTGSISVGELEMARRISAVAVCCSSASVSSRLRASSAWNSRAFSTAMTAWLAKAASRSICSGVNARTSWRQIEMTPTGTPSRSSGTQTPSARPAASPSRAARGLPRRRHGRRSCPGCGPAGARPPREPAPCGVRGATSGDPRTPMALPGGRPVGTSPRRRGTAGRRARRRGAGRGRGSPRRRARGRPGTR